MEGEPVCEFAGGRTNERTARRAPFRKRFVALKAILRLQAHDKAPFHSFAFLYIARNSRNSRAGPCSSFLGHSVGSPLASGTFCSGDGGGGGGGGTRLVGRLGGQAGGQAGQIVRSFRHYAVSEVVRPLLVSNPTSKEVTIADAAVRSSVHPSVRSFVRSLGRRCRRRADAVSQSSFSARFANPWK